MQKDRLKRALTIILLSLGASAANYILARLSVITGTGLFLDTIFTITASLNGGILTGFLTSILSTIAFGAYDNIYWEYYLFGLCSIATALVTCFFAKLEKTDLNITHNSLQYNKLSPGAVPSKSSLPDRLIMLFLFSLALCILMSVLGGLIAVFIELALNTPMQTSPEIWFKLGLLHQGLDLLPAEIFARFPINIVERPISVFAGYGIALLLKRIAAKGMFH
jgi:hypothetical protein